VYVDINKLWNVCSAWHLRRFRSFIGHITPVVPIVRGHFHCGVSAFTNFGCFFSWDTFEPAVSFSRTCRDVRFAVQALPDLRGIPPEDPAQVAIQYTCSQLCMCLQGSPVEIQTPAHRDRIDRGMTATPPPSSHNSFRPSSKHSVRVSEILLQFLCSFKKFVSLELRKSKGVSVVNGELSRCSYWSRQGRYIQFPVLVS